ELSAALTKLTETEYQVKTIHYSRKPAAYKIYQNRSKYVDEAEAHIAKLNKRKRKKSRKTKKTQ
ncbi:hypothetical protein, partial [Bacteroides acidifaciens]|uniref:hypothetical protein n=1 Tax=Bacteroides acidifaciens TaxID=85831 RepID=UPI0025A5CABD